MILIQVLSCGESTRRETYEWRVHNTSVWSGPQGDATAWFADSERGHTDLLGTLLLHIDPRLVKDRLPDACEDKVSVLLRCGGDDL